MPEILHKSKVRCCPVKRHLVTFMGPATDAHGVVIAMD